jgi:hypothetical protein
MKALFGVFSVLLCCFAQAGGVLSDQTYKDWYAGGTKDGYTMAITVNPDGRALGQFCYHQDNHCEWRMSMDTACQTGATALILINGDSVFTYSNITCLGMLGNGKNLYTYRIENWRGMEDIFAGALGGALAGNAVQKKYDAPIPAQQIIVRVRSGVLVAVTEPIGPNLVPGEKVYIEGNGEGARVVPQGYW